MSASRSTTRPSRPTQFALGAFAGLAVVGVVAWGLRSSSGSRGEPAAGTPQKELAAAPEPEAALAFADTPEESNSASQEPTARVELATPPKLVMERPRIIHGGDTIHGRCLLEHADVPEGLLAPRAAFVLDVAFKGAVRSLDVEVVRGHWSCELPVPFRDVLRFSVHDVQIDGRPCDQRASITPAVGAEELPYDVVVRSHCAWDALLEVVDALTQRPLDEVLVVATEFTSSDLPVFHSRNPAPAPRLAPVDLSAFATKMPEQNFFVSSPGYGWKRVKVDLSRESSHRVELVPGGDLTLIGAPSGGDLRLSEVRADGSLREVITGSISTLPWKLTGLAPGEYEVLTFPSSSPSDPWITCLSGTPTLRFGELTLIDSHGNPIEPEVVANEALEAPPKPLPQLRLRLRVALGTVTEFVLDR